MEGIKRTNKWSQFVIRCLGRKRILYRVDGQDIFTFSGGHRCRYFTSRTTSKSWLVLVHTTIPVDKSS